LLAAFAIEVRADADVDGKALPGMALVDATHGRDVAIISSVGQSNVPESNGTAERRIKG
jgi:hypothetical protein